MHGRNNVTCLVNDLKLNNAEKNVNCSKRRSLKKASKCPTDVQAMEDVVPEWEQKLSARLADGDTEKEDSQLRMAPWYQPGLSR